MIWSSNVCGELRVQYEGTEEQMCLELIMLMDVLLKNKEICEDDYKWIGRAMANEKGFHKFAKKAANVAIESGIVKKISIDGADWT